MMSNVNLRPIQHSAVNYGRFGLLRGSLAPPRPRRPTKPTRGSKLRRLADKRKRSEVKARRRRPSAE